MVLSWTRTMIRHPKAVQELSMALQVIRPMMVDPDVSREEKRGVLNVMVNELSEKTFKLKPVAQQIMTIINMKKEVCEEYPDAEAQVEGVLSWLPRFSEHRDILLNEVKRNRKEFGLEI